MPRKLPLVFRRCVWGAGCLLGFVALALLGIVAVVLTVFAYATTKGVELTAGAGKWVAHALAGSYPRTVAVLLLVAIAAGCGGCAARASRAESFEYWLRYYETRMALPPHELQIGRTPIDSCGWVGFVPEVEGFEPRGVAAAPRLRGPVVIYDPDLDGCRSPADVALHEACHLRYAHPWLDLEGLGIDAELEAKACEVEYLRRLRSDLRTAPPAF